MVIYIYFAAKIHLFYDMTKFLPFFLPPYEGEVGRMTQNISSVLVVAILVDTRINEIKAYLCLACFIE